MKGTILDFLKLAAEKPELAKELAKVGAKYDFEFTDEVTDEDLEAVAGGVLPVPTPSPQEHEEVQAEQQLSPFSNLSSGAQARHKLMQTIIDNMRA
jgi:hypothetical protein